MNGKAESMIYLDNAATTFPKPIAVRKEVLRCMTEYGGNPGRGGHPLSLAASEAVYSVRQSLADFFGISKAEHIVFTKNCTEALNLAIRGIAKRGDHFLISDLEHNSVLRTMEALAIEKGIRYDTFCALGTDEDILADIRAKCRQNTKAIVTLHASNVCPYVLPIAKIGDFCHRKGLALIVDAAQSAGIYDVNITRDHISILCAPGHKGLYGPQGSGFAAFADDFDFSDFFPCLYGGNGRNSAELSMGHDAPESFEAGTLSTPAIVGLGEGLRFVRLHRRERIEAAENQLYRALKTQMESVSRVRIYLPQAEHGSLMLLGFDGISASAVAEALSAYGVCTRAGLHCSPLAHRTLGTDGDALRISFSVMNTFSEIEAFSRILRNVIR